ncbi:MAG TPA: DUF971 domain-containing protein [Caulobacteraceae bacterium]|jgi:DUF971 family protein|nr:DUF971 domain-containing protein [Caulobacteraceae bacterium]
MTGAVARPWPLELKVRRAARVLEISFDDGKSFSLPAEFLRVMTPSAIDRGHGAGPGRAVAGKRGVGIADVQAIGRYAARLIFDDGHDTGLYSWDELYRLGRDQARLWADYERRLAHEGLSRDF